ncbi:hypothetical protein N2152v2_006919 [Parachlorella kessleri]
MSMQRPQHLLHDGNSQLDDGFEEETVYVLLELPDGEALPPPGTCLQLKGMDTDEPVLAWDGGPALLGEYEETVGTELLFKDEVHGDGSHTVGLHSHTTNKLRFRKPLPPAEEPQPPVATGNDAAADQQQQGGQHGQLQTGSQGQGEQQQAEVLQQDQQLQPQQTSPPEQESLTRPSGQDQEGVAMEA